MINLNPSTKGALDLCVEHDGSGSDIYCPRAEKVSLEEEFNRIVSILRQSHHAKYDEALLVHPFIPAFFPKRRRGQTDFIVRVDNIHEYVSCEIYYRVKHEQTIYKNIEAAYIRCHDVLTTASQFADNNKVRVSIGCFNYRNIPYTISRKMVQDIPLVEIELHSRFKSDQKDQILPLVNRVRDCI